MLHEKPFLCNKNTRSTKKNSCWLQLYPSSKVTLRTYFCWHLSKTQKDKSNQTIRDAPLYGIFSEKPYLLFLKGRKQQLHNNFFLHIFGIISLASLGFTNWTEQKSNVFMWITLPMYVNEQSLIGQQEWQMTVHKIVLQEDSFFNCMFQNGSDHE